ncbi:ATPase [Nocardia seriolae]|uniref:ATPase n=2 Tax=Nocardia seriolae TaxID=37332 RepID=A0ABC9Z492_9NOCA|nr:RecA/RadA recombinase [Nocardia seriolae]GAP32612.1 ATPase [Nocardia seriolae]
MSEATMNDDATLSEDPRLIDGEIVRELADIPAVEVISRAAVMLMSSAAEKLGLGEPDPSASPHLDLDEARRVITALAGLVTASVEYLGPHAGPIRDGLQSLQRAFRESSEYPDAPGAGPGEKYTGPVY